MTRSKALTQRAIPKILRHLKPKQAKFVMAYARSGKVGEAAAEVGIAPRTGYRYMTDEAVRDAVLGQLEQDRARYAAIGFKVLVELAEDADSDSVRASAARELVRRGIGEVGAVIDHRHSHKIETNTAQVLERIAELQKELGFNGNIVNAEYEEVEEPEEPGSSLVKRLPFQVA